jgi:DNA polymerase-3 subunit delta'
MSWSRIKGHDPIVNLFVTAYSQGRLGHAYLFIGPTGVGKQTFARELAKALLCERPLQKLVACDTCPSCHLAEAGTHPDLICAKRPDDVVELPVSVIREMSEQLSLKPARGGRKVAILDDADDLNEASANAFLKTLEEPPPGSLLILIGGGSADRQLPTILSRCQIVRFAPLPAETVESLLKEHEVTEPARLQRLLRVAEGSVGQALALDDEELWNFRTLLLKNLSANQIDSLILAKAWHEFVEDAGKESGAKRRRASLILKLLLGLLQDALRITHGIAPTVADRAEAETLRDLADRLGTDRLLGWMQRGLEAETQVDRMVQLELISEAFADYLGR